MDDKTISTMNEVTNKRRGIDTGGNNKGPPSKPSLDTEDSSEGCSVSSMSSQTRQATKSDFSQLTVKMKDIKEMINTLMASQMRQNQPGGQEPEILEY
jgi:hypothetical protein